MSQASHEPPLNHPSTDMYFRGKPQSVDSALGSYKKDAYTDNLAHRIFESATDGFLEWRPLSNGFAFSPSFATMLGYPMGGLPLNAANIGAHIYPDDYADVKLFMAKAMMSGEDGEIKFRMITQAAKVSWFQMRLRIVAHTTDGQIDTAIACVSNVDHIVFDQNQTQAENEQWLRSAIREVLQQQDDDGLNDCLKKFCIRAKVDHVILRQVYRKGESYRFIAKGHRNQNHESLDFSKTVLRQDMPYEFAAAEKGKPVLINDFETLNALSPEFKRDLQNLEIRSLAILPIFYQGSIDYYLSLIMTSENVYWPESTIKLAEALGDALAQVAARRRITKALALNEERFQNALDAAQDGIWDWNIKTNKFFVTPTFLYMLGYDEEYLPLNREKIAKILSTPMTLEDFFTPSNASKGHMDKVTPFKHRDGHMVWVWIRAKHIEWDERGKPIRSIGVNADISQFRAGFSHNGEFGVTAHAGTSASNNIATENIKAIDSNQNSAADQNKPPLSMDEILRTAKILLAEDNPINQQVATGILKLKGIAVTIVNNGQEAIDTLNSSPPDRFNLLLMDMEMPVLDGYAAAKQLRGDSRFDNLPIIALTAHARDEDREHCFSLGMNDHVAKPIKPDLLYSAITKQLENKQQVASN